MAEPMPEGNWLSKGRAREIIQREEQRQESFEELAVKRILAAANIRHNLTESRAEAARITRAHALSFAWFRDKYPRFPVRLAACKLPFIRGVQVADFWGPRFAKTVFFKEYRKFIASEDIDEARSRVGFLFNWPEIGMTVLHNYPVQHAYSQDVDSRVERGTRIVRQLGAVIYVVEAVSDFLANIGDDWTTE